LLPALGFAADKLSVTASNPLPLARASQTMELTAQQLAPLGEKDLNKLHVFDAAGKEVLSQAVDTDGDAYRTPDTRNCLWDISICANGEIVNSLWKRRSYPVSSVVEPYIQGNLLSTRLDASPPFNPEAFCKNSPGQQ
jgi:hypothetical protein